MGRKAGKEKDDYNKEMKGTTEKKQPQFSALG